MRPIPSIYVSILFTNEKHDFYSKIGFTQRSFQVDQSSTSEFRRTPRCAVYEEGEPESVLVWFGEGGRDGERKIFSRYHWSSKKI